MKLIAHRGNINGPDPENENSPKYVESAIQQGYDVEIDLRVGVGLQLGHDKSQYFIDSSWLNTFKDNLWIHCKDFATLTYLTERRFVGYNYFWHQDDDYTLTSQGYIWTYPGKDVSKNSVLVDLEGVNREADCYGICSDYVGNLK